jgi:hypothetical protein
MAALVIELYHTDTDHTPKAGARNKATKSYPPIINVRKEQIISIFLSGGSRVAKQLAERGSAPSESDYAQG